MTPSRREFVRRAVAGILGAAAAGARAASPSPAASPAAPSATPAAPAAGTPPAFGTASPSGPAISAATITEAEKLVRLTFTQAQKTQMAANWRSSMAATMERRTGPRKVALEDSLSPAAVWNPMVAGVPVMPSRDRFVRSPPDAEGPLPNDD